MFAVSCADLPLCILDLSVECPFGVVWVRTGRRGLPWFRFGHHLFLTPRSELVFLLLSMLVHTSTLHIEVELLNCCLPL